MIRLPLRERPRPIIVTPDVAAAWAEYEVAGRRALAQYAELPIAMNRVDPAPQKRCIHCGHGTRAHDGQCRRCKRAVVA